MTCVVLKITIQLAFNGVYVPTSTTGLLTDIY